MIVIKEGDQLKAVDTKIFSCPKCGCEFEANKNEYKIGIKYNQKYFHCECPCCKEEVYRE